MPALKDKQGEYLLKELLKRWANHKVMVRWLSRFFNYLDRWGVALCRTKLYRSMQGPATVLSQPAATAPCIMRGCIQPVLL